MHRSILQITQNNDAESLENVRRRQYSITKILKHEFMNARSTTFVTFMLIFCA